MSTALFSSDGGRKSILHMMESENWCGIGIVLTQQMEINVST